MMVAGDGSWRDGETHQGFCRVCIADKSLRGVKMVRWFFEPSARRGRSWRTRQIAHIAVVPMADVHKAMVAAREQGLVELTEKGWRWIG